MIEPQVLIVNNFSIFGANIAFNMGFVRSSFSCGFHLHNRLMTFINKNDISQSTVIQHALRQYLDREEKLEINAVLDCRSDDELEKIALELKKRGVI